MNKKYPQAAHNISSMIIMWWYGEVPTKISSYQHVASLYYLNKKKQAEIKRK